jgi:hypothetical protein
LRKVAILSVALAAMLVTAVVAFGQGGNSYTVEASVSPNTSGTTSRPQPVKVTFNYTVNGPDSATQPAAVSRYTIELYGIRENGLRFPKCTAAAMQRAGGDSDCPAGSRMGSGTLQAVVYPSNDPKSTSTINCTKSVRFYNAGDRRAVIFLTGPASQCGGVGQPFIIPATFVNGAGGGESLRFTVPPAVLHPVAGLTVAVRNVTTSINVKTRRVRGKRVGYFESRRCLGARRPIRVTFVEESGTSSRATDSALCRRSRSR